MTTESKALALQIRLLDWNRAQATPPITPGYEYGVASAALELMQPATRQYYYRKDGCKAYASIDSDCICWYDEGTGPLFNNHMTTVQPSSWREKPSASAQPDPIIGVLKSNLAEGVRPSFSGGDLKHLIKLLETPHAEAAALREELAETIQSAWDAAGGNPGIKATRDELISALRLMDAADDEHAKIEQRLAAAEQRNSYVERVLTSLMNDDDGLLCLAEVSTGTVWRALQKHARSVDAALKPTEPAASTICAACDGAGSVGTGIAEASSTICNKCEGTGSKP